VLQQALGIGDQGLELGGKRLLGVAQVALVLGHVDLGERVEFVVHGRIQGVLYGHVNLLGAIATGECLHLSSPWLAARFPRRSRRLSEHSWCVVHSVRSLPVRGERNACPIVAARWTFVIVMPLR